MKYTRNLPMSGVDPKKIDLGVGNFVKPKFRFYGRILIWVPSELTLDTYCMRLSEFYLTFLYSENFKFACYLGRFDLQNALNLLKCAVCSHTACMPCLSKICLGPNSMPPNSVYQYLS